MSGTKRIAVAMSGGVDSSVAAALLAEQGGEVFGLMMRLWSEDSESPNRCCSPHDMAVARRIAAQLGIPFYVVDFQELFKRKIVDFLVDGYAQGVTPNPCMQCNRWIRWDALLRHALSLGATHLATGHYARLEAQDGVYHLYRGSDTHKDQSYVLSFLRQTQLAHAVFPLGQYTKPATRELARHFDIPVAERPESQDLCFVSDGDYRAFLRRQRDDLPPPGPILDPEGNLLGQHRGLSHYTIGQRKGIGIAAPEALYVLRKDLARNALIVGPRRALGRRQFETLAFNWLRGEPPEFPLSAHVQVRYKARAVEAEVTPSPGRDGVEFRLAEMLPDITPGQAAVIYLGDECLGGGVIAA